EPGRCRSADFQSDQWPSFESGLHQRRFFWPFACSVLNFAKAKNSTFPPTAEMTAPDPCTRPMPSPLSGKLHASHQTTGFLGPGSSGSHMSQHCGLDAWESFMPCRCPCEQAELFIL